jgi:hypothetical protein
VVKTLGKLITALVVQVVLGRVWLLELVAVVMLACAFGIWWGLPAVLVVLAVACLLKSFEYEMGAAPRRRGGS